MFSPYIKMKRYFMVVANRNKFFVNLSNTILIAGSLWSRKFLKSWFVIPSSCTIYWMLYNNMLFQPEKHIKHWISQVQIAEALWKQKVALFKQNHTKQQMVLYLGNIIGYGLTVYGGVRLRALPTVLGLIIHYVSKVFFYNKMIEYFEKAKAMMKQLGPVEQQLKNL